MQVKTVTEGNAASGVQVIPSDHLNDLMSTSDYVVAALPHTSGTDKLISRAAIKAMKETGVFVNVGRGGTVDEPALIEGECPQFTSTCATLAQKISFHRRSCSLALIPFSVALPCLCLLLLKLVPVRAVAGVALCVWSCV